MRTVWKFPLEVIDSQELDLPQGTEPLAVQWQGSHLCLWAIVDPDAPKVRRTVRIYGTGHRAPDDLSAAAHIGTFQMSGGALIFHAFLY